MNDPVYLNDTATDAVLTYRSGRTVEFRLNHLRPPDPAGLDYLRARGGGDLTFFTRGDLIELLTVHIENIVPGGNTASKNIIEDITKLLDEAQRAVGGLPIDNFRYAYSSIVLREDPSLPEGLTGELPVEALLRFIGYENIPTQAYIISDDGISFNIRDSRPIYDFNSAKEVGVNVRGLELGDYGILFTNNLDPVGPPYITLSLVEISMTRSDHPIDWLSAFLYATHSSLIARLGRREIADNNDNSLDMLQHFRFALARTQSEVVQAMIDKLNSFAVTFRTLYDEHWAVAFATLSRKLAEDVEFIGGADSLDWDLHYQYAIANSHLRAGLLADLIAKYRFALTHPQAIYSRSSARGAFGIKMIKEAMEIRLQVQAPISLKAK